jgi:uncharacterized phage-associated protein
MSTSPTAESILGHFRHKHLDKIEGLPDFASLTKLRKQVKDNAASIRTSAGGGAHGYLGIVISPAEYARVSNVPFITPPPTEAVAQNLPNAAAALRVAFHAHNEAFRAWNEYQLLEQVLKHQVAAAIDPIYLRDQEDLNVGFAHTTIRAILETLFLNYGQLTSLELQENNTRMNQPWNGNTNFTTLIHQIETCTELAEAGGCPFTDQQVINTAHSLVYNTGLFYEECARWDRKPAIRKTWTNFKTHFLMAERELRKQQKTTQFSSTHTANALFQQQTVEALANLATTNQHMLDATQQDRNAMTTLVRQNQELQQQLANLRKNNNTTPRRSNRSSNHNSGTTTAPPTTLTRNPRYHGRNPNPYNDNGNYCWTHGYGVADNHTSATCRNPSEGHQTTATRANTMGGSNRGLPT